MLRQWNKGLTWVDRHQICDLAVQMNVTNECTLRCAIRLDKWRSGASGLSQWSVTVKNDIWDYKSTTLSKTSETVGNHKSNILLDGIHWGWDLSSTVTQLCLKSKATVQSCLVSWTPLTIPQAFSKKKNPTTSGQDQILINLFLKVSASALIFLNIKWTVLWTIIFTQFSPGLDDQPKAN